MDIIAHRGCVGVGVENTLNALSHALNLGVDGIEVDVHLTNDHRVVVYHDFALHSPPGAVHSGHFLCDMSWPEIQEWDLIALPDPEKIPTLDQVLTLFAHHPHQKCQIHIELKVPECRDDLDGYGINLWKACFDLVDRHGIHPRARYLSFDFKTLIDLKFHNPGATCCFLTKDIQSPWPIYDAGGQFWYPHYNDVTADTVYQAQKLGLSVVVWTPNGENEMSDLLDLNVDGIITDRADVLQNLVARLGK